MSSKELHFQKVNDEIKRHLEDTETSKLAHWHAASVYDKVHKLYLGLPATVLSIFLAWLISGEVKNTEMLNSAGSAFIADFPVVISLVVSVLSGLAAFLNFHELSSRHRMAAENLHAVWRDCKNWATDFPDYSYCEDAVKKAQMCRARLNDINKDAPQIPKWAWKSVQKQKDSGSVSYNFEARESATVTQ